MQKGTNIGFGSVSHRVLKDRARARVDDLQLMLAGLQSARKDGRPSDATLIEDQIQRMLREWKAELADASPDPSLIGSDHGAVDPYLDIDRMLKLWEGEGGAAANGLVELLAMDPKAELLDPVFRGLECGGTAVFQEDYYPSHDLQEPGLVRGSPPELKYKKFPLPFAFVRMKCALWDCPRPSQGSEWWQDYCSNFHATLAFNEGPPGMAPVLRPGGIDLKDGPLFAALSAKARGKNVGIPECQGAATTKSPWNAPELFDLSVLNGESLREWLFFDKPRRAFESGNRKQRSLPDYGGRGWHESRKQVMKEFGGLKRSYYMDPQPLRHYEWHLYEYEINGCDDRALYRLELKLADPRKSVRGKVTATSPFHLRKQTWRLNDRTDEIESRLDYGPNFPYSYSVENRSGYYGT